MSLIDISYFLEGDLAIPNTGETPVIEQLNGYIQKYEQEFLRRLLGYPLYKAFVTGIAVTAPTVPDQRFLDILYGKEYTNLQGFLTQWRGLIMTDTPVYNTGGQTVYKKPVYITAGTTAGFMPNTNVAVLDGTNGTDDWRGWTPILFRDSLVMVPGEDYSWDPVTGTLTLLSGNDVFENGEQFFAQFEDRTDPINSTDISTALSPIANYVYYWYRRAGATQYTGIGEVRTNAENSANQDPNQKMASAWNEMHRWIWEFIEFMDTNVALTPQVYPEWIWIYRWQTLRYFEFSNPIF